MVRGRDSRCPDDFFNRFEPEQKEKIKFLGIDRSNVYKAAALRHMPHIKVCYDAYHLVSNMNQVLDKIRRFARKISEQFNEVINGIRYHINSARIESANASIKRIQAKACGLFDVRYLFLKLRQIYFLRLQRKHKTSRFYYQQI